MSSKEKEYQELFIAEATQNVEELNRLMTLLEKEPESKAKVDEIFRIIHTLKGNAAGMGFEIIAGFAHKMEDVFGAIKNQKLTIEDELFSLLFKAVDVLSDLVGTIGTEQKVRYKGLETRLKLVMEKAGKKDLNKSAPTKKTTAKKKTTSAIAKSTVPKEEPASAEAANASEEAKEEEVHKMVFSDTISIPSKKLDNLLNLVGELIIERDRLMAVAGHNGGVVRNEYNRLNRISSDLQYSVMDARLVQVGFLFNKFHRLVRDTAKSEGKDVELQISGAETEIDRNVLQIISDSLVHLIRNAIGHGLEATEERKKAGKSPKGMLSLKASNESEGVVLEIQDDGRGINIDRVKTKVLEKGLCDENTLKTLSEEEIIHFIFHPGFSTNDQVTNISGRGVGMDVVKKALDTVGGNIQVKTVPGEGTSFRLVLPASMAVKSTLLFEISDTPYAIPLTYTHAVVSVWPKVLTKIGTSYFTVYQEKTIPLIFLDELFFEQAQCMRERLQQKEQTEKLPIVVVQYNGKTVGFVVDKLLQQKEIVEKPLKKPVDNLSFISGVTILGNGNVCLVINVPQIIQGIFSAQSKNLVNPVSKS